MCLPAVADIDTIIVLPPSTTTPSGCEIRIHPFSLAPLSKHLIHSPNCVCSSGTEAQVLSDYVSQWVTYRTERLRESAVVATAWARMACRAAGIEDVEDLKGVKMIDSVLSSIRQMQGMKL